MEKIKVITLLFLLIFVPMLGIGFSAKAASTAESDTVMIAQLEQEIRDIISQITDLVQSLSQQRASAGVGDSSGTAILRVNVLGTTAYVSVNGGPASAYISPITLNTGDTYSVTASVPSNNGSGNSTSKCDGIASSGGSYVCNININSN